MTNKSFAIIVVTYFPDNDSLTHILSIADMADCIVIADNTPEGVDLGKSDHSKVRIIRNNKNVGLAKALNDGIEYARRFGFKDIFLFDQDSKPDEYFFESMLQFKTRIEQKISNCAFCVPNFYDRNSCTYAKFPILSEYSIQHKCCKKVKSFYPKKALVAITSGTLLNYERYRQIGPFSEEYFIDFIDNEYCLRAAKKGFVVAVNCAATLNHSIGCRENKKFLGVRFKPNNHPALRRYYISRNGIRTALFYLNDFKSYFFLIILRMIHETLSIIFYESQKSVKIKAICRGCIDGLIGKMGPYTHPD